MGSAALYHLSKRGGTALGIDQFDVPNEMGSSHGLTRIIRLAYHEHSSYVPLLLRAFELWRNLEEEAKEHLLVRTGSVDAGLPGSSVFEGSLKSCQIHNLRHEVLTSAQLHARFPGYQLPADMMAVLQQDGGYLRPEACISAHVAMAKSRGAQIHTGEKVISWEPSQGGVRVTTEDGTYSADRLVCSAGAWMPKLVKSLQEIAIPERQVVVWFEPRRPEYFSIENFPVFNLIGQEGNYYGFPIAESPGFKVGRYHHRNEIANPDQINRECYPEDESLLREFVERYFPDAAGPAIHMQCCLFTNTPDGHFILDVHPEWPQVIVASPCSGHGFKFSSVIGEILADLAESGETAHDISMHRLNRFGPKVISDCQSF